MQIEFVARDFRIDETFRGFASGKLKKLEKFLHEPIAAHVVLEVEKHRHRAEIQVHHRHGNLQATEETEDMQGSLNLVVDKLEKQARRSSKKFQTTRRRAARHEVEQIWAHRTVKASGDEADSVPRVVAARRLQVKPMTVDEAVLKLESSGSEFLVFRESEGQTISVLYRKTDGDYGLIAPEI